jgi:hypothetical protein
LAILDNFTLYSQYVSYRGSNYGFRSTGNTPSMGNINSSSIQYTVNSNWYTSASVNMFYTYNTTLYLDLDGTTSNSGWQDIRVDGTIFNRTSASYSSSIDRWNWNNITVPFGNNVSHDIVITDDGQLQSSGVTIPFGQTSGAIDMNNLRNFYGEPSWGSSMISMSDLFRGGNLVPDRSANSAVPTSGAIAMNDFYGNETYLMIEKQPTLKSYFGGFGGSGTAVLTWNIATDPNSQSDIDVGYKALKSLCEYRWIINVTNTSDDPLYPQIIYNGTNTNNPSMPHTTAWSADPTLTIEVDHGVQTGSIAGTAYFEVRKIWNGTTYSETSSSAFWSVIIETAGE